MTDLELATAFLDALVDESCLTYVRDDSAQRDCTDVIIDGSAIDMLAVARAVRAKFERGPLVARSPGFSMLVPRL